MQVVFQGENTNHLVIKITRAIDESSGLKGAWHLSYDIIGQNICGTTITGARQKRELPLLPGTTALEAVFDAIRGIVEKNGKLCPKCFGALANVSIIDELKNKIG